MKTDRAVIARGPLERPRGRAEGAFWKWMSFGIMLALSFLVFDALAQRSASDLSIHATWAAEGDFLEPRTFLRHGAHPLWHGLVAFVMLFAVPAKLAATVVTALLKVAELWLIHRLLTAYLREKLTPNQITLAAFAVSLVAALWVPWVNPRVYVGAGTPNIWHSPTQMIAMVFMLLCVPYTAHCYAGFESLLPALGDKALLPWRKAVALGGMLLGSLLAKPTFMQAFMPAACLYFLFQWVRHPKNSRFFWQIILAVLPAALFMILQYLYYFGIIVPSQGNMVLETSWAKLGYGLRAVLLIVAFPLAQVLFRSGRREKDPLMSLTLLFFAVSVAEYLILGEDGRRAQDGNFGWGMMGAALMLWVMGLVSFLEDWAYSQGQGGLEPRGRGDGPSGLARMGLMARLALLLWHLGSGFYYIVYLLTTTKSL